MNSFLWEVQTKSYLQEVLSRDWSKAQSQFLCHNAKIKSFHFLEKSCPFNNLPWGFSICWHFCSKDGSWRDWYLISEEFIWSLEDLGAQWSTEKAGGLVKALVVLLRFENAWGKSRLGQHMEFSFLTAALKNSTFHYQMIFLSNENWNFLWTRIVEFQVFFVSFPSVVRGITTSLYHCLNLWGTSSLSHHLINTS